MDRNDINRIIHEEILGKCGHRNRKTYIDPGPTFTERCKDCDRLATFPDYCSDDSPRALLNEVEDQIIGLVGELRYEALVRFELPVCPSPSIVNAPALIRATACVAAHQEGRGRDE